MGMFKKIAQQLKVSNEKQIPEHVTLPFGKEFLTEKNSFLKDISKKAVDLYEKQSDIKHFSELVLSNPENTSHNKMVEKLFEDGVADPFIDDKLADLANNQKFLKDLGLL